MPNMQELISLGSLGIGAIGSLIGIEGFLIKKESKSNHLSEWKGEVNTKLDTILSTNKDTSRDVKNIISTLSEHGERLSAVEQLTRRYPNRLDKFYCKSKGGDTNVSK